MKRTISLALAAGLLLAAAVGSAGCDSKYAYTECTSPLQYEAEYEGYFFRPTSHVYRFDRLAVEGGISFYYESDMSGGKVDDGIGKVLRLSELFAIEKPVYLSEEAMTHANETEFWVDPGDSAELIGGTYLAECAGERLPFGVYAGACAVLLGGASGGRDPSKRSDGCTELEYPLFTEDGADKKTRKAAWELAAAVAGDFLDGRSLEELLASGVSDWEEIFARRGVTVPAYRFRVGDTAFPVKIETADLRLYFSRDFRDRCYFEEFSYDYPVLTAFAGEGEAYLRETAELFGYGGFPEPVNVFFGNKFLPITSSGVTYPERNLIACNSVGAFAHEVTHMVTHYARGAGGYPLEEAIAQYFSFRSAHAPWTRLSLYWAYEGRTVRDLLYEEAGIVTEDGGERVRAAADVYDRRFGRATEEDFSALGFLLCCAGLFAGDDATPSIPSPYHPLRVSFVHYLMSVYGMEGLLEVNRNYGTAKIGETDFEGIVAGWREWLRENYT